MKQMFEVMNEASNRRMETMNAAIKGDLHSVTCKMDSIMGGLEGKVSGIEEGLTDLRSKVEKDSRLVEERLSRLESKDLRLLTRR